MIAKHFGNKPYLFQEDGASIHTSHLMNEYRAQGCFQPANFPLARKKPRPQHHRESVGHFSILKHHLHRRLEEIKSNDDLTSVVREIWNDIPLTYVRNLYRSIPTRLKKAIND